MLAVSGLGAAGQVSLLASVAEEIFTNTNLVEQRATSADSEFLDAKFAADLQAAEELSDKLAKKAEFDAEAASTKAAEAAQAGLISKLLIELLNKRQRQSLRVN